MHGGLRTYNNLNTVSAIKVSPNILGFIPCILPVFNFFGLNNIRFHWTCVLLSVDLPPTFHACCFYAACIVSDGLIRAYYRYGLPTEGDWNNTWFYVSVHSLFRSWLLMLLCNLIFYIHVASTKINLFTQFRYIWHLIISRTMVSQKSPSITPITTVYADKEQVLNRQNNCLVYIMSMLSG